jgi:hypothetical protein
MTLDLEGERRHITQTGKEPYVVEPADTRLIYRTGDGHNHNLIYTLVFEDVRVREASWGRGSLRFHSSWDSWWPWLRAGRCSGWAYGRSMSDRCLERQVFARPQVCM